MDALIGYTGFVGNNLLNQTSFDELYNSKNIDAIKGKKFKRIICAGASAVKWKANKFPEEDLQSISLLIENLRHVECEEFILISTVDVYTSPTNVNENSVIHIEKLHPYGKHRFMLENFVKEKFTNSTIIRLPGLFGPSLKKNIIYDFMNNNNLDQIDSRNIFQFYNLERLLNDINICLRNNLKLINFATEPISVREVVSYAFATDFDNNLMSAPVKYDMQSIYGGCFDNSSPYLYSKESVLEDIKKFVDNYRGK